MSQEIEDIVSVSGTSGLFRMAANKKNGLILEELDTGKKRFFSAMRYQFTPLGSIAIYTMRDTVPIDKVFRNMMQQYEDNPPVDPSEPKEELEEYFMDILPDYDSNKVFVGDIKKIIKWFNFLYDRNIISLEDDPLAGSTEEE